LLPSATGATFPAGVNGYCCPGKQLHCGHCCHINAALAYYDVRDLQAVQGAVA